MNWIMWTSPRSGNEISRAHIAENFSALRTLCGWSIPALAVPASRKKPRCQACLIASGQKPETRGPFRPKKVTRVVPDETDSQTEPRPQQYFLSKDGKTKYLVSRNFPEDA